jgi:O-antigen ligase
MSIVAAAVYIYVPMVLAYAFKDWFKALCGLILLMAVIQHSAMPKNMLGIQGLNLWNILFVGVCMAWLASRHRENAMWDMPRHIRVLLLLCLVVILVGFLRAVFDRTNIENYPLKNLISEELINTVKWPLVGILLFHGCRTRGRVMMVLACLLVMYSVIAVQVVKLVPSGAIHSHLALDQGRMLIEDTGYNPVDISGLLAGTFWGTLAILPLISQKKYKIILLLAAGLFAYGQAITGGRAGYIAWGGTGLVLCILKWRKQLILAPVVIVLLPIVFPAAADRLFVGFGLTDAAGQTTMDDAAMTSGRTLTWRYVIDKIRESPLLGYGRRAMQRTGLSQRVLVELGETSNGHPHNMYLETLLDNGIIGSIPMFLFYGVILVYSARLFRTANCLYSAVGGLALALMLAHLFTGIGSQHFYPEEQTFGMWTAMFLALRVYLEEKRVQFDALSAAGHWNTYAFPEYCRTAASPSA